MATRSGSDPSGPGCGAHLQRTPPSPSVRAEPRACCLHHTMRSAVSARRRLATIGPEVLSMRMLFMLCVTIALLLSGRAAPAQDALPADAIARIDAAATDVLKDRRAERVDRGRRGRPDRLHARVRPGAARAEDAGHAGDALQHRIGQQAVHGGGASCCWPRRASCRSTIGRALAARSHARRRGHDPPAAVDDVRATRTTGRRTT